MSGTNPQLATFAGQSGGVSGSGSTGHDYSANGATIPLAGTVLLATVPVNAARFYVAVQNQSAGSIQVVRDDGAGANQTSVLLASGGAGLQGGGWDSATFRGRVRVYGASGAQVSAFED